jgi:folate-binding protein YgfZ
VVIGRFNKHKQTNRLRTKLYDKTADLNLDIEEVGVSFTKGCYPGQEVVARVHYLVSNNNAKILMNFMFI